ncbi:zinc finger and SCAN domain-containing protein 2-like isoform X6 [Engraulis encrasicolus]|uniref:zinc finger and SCAN domain-containing protein 2-like isoform X6 n=1 Tax=Engraulis encrasicolus TaxID=184585 RepID=UPI002FD6D653
MPHSCIYPGCGLKHKPYNEESFHELPYRHDDQELLQRWLTVLNIDITTPVETLKEKRYRVCSRHFDKDDFIQPRTVKENRVQRVRVQLKKYAIPRPRVGPPATGTVEVPDAGSSSPLSVYSSTGPSSPVPMPTVAASYAESLPSLPLATVKEEGGSAAVCGAVWNSHTHTGSNHTPLTHIHEREHSYAEGRSTPFLRSEKISLQEEVTVQVSCLLQLFDRCLGCSAGSCSVLTRRDGRVFHVTQQCWTCQIIVEWDSHTADSGTANKQQEGRGEGGGERGVVEIKEEWEEIQVQEEEEEQPREEQPGEEQPREEQRGAGRRKQRRREERVEEEQTPLETLDEDEEDEDAVEGEGISGKQRGRKRRRKKMMRRMRMQDINEQDDDDYDEEGEDNDEEYDEEEEKVQWLEKAKKRREEMDQDWAPEDDQMLPESERRSSCSEEYDDDDGVDDEDWERELCSECGKKFRNRPDKPHVCLHKAKPVECHICGKRCLNEQGLSVHIAHCHERGPQCKYCNTTLRNAEEKLQHEETSHRDEEGPKYRCRDCSERFHNYESRAAHRRTAHDTTCPFCDKMFKNEFELRRHKLIHTGKKPFSCRICERSFSQRGHLKSHMRLHTGERPFKCTQCERSFNHNVSLKNHLQRHHGAKTGPAQQETSGTQQEGSRTDQSSRTSEHTLLSRIEEDTSQNSITCSRTEQGSGTSE